jgi:hypothetical protein
MLLVINDHGSRQGKAISQEQRPPQRVAVVPTDYPTKRKQPVAHDLPAGPARLTARFTWSGFVDR